MIIIMGGFNVKIGDEKHLANVAGKYTLYNATSEKVTSWHSLQQGINYS
jgi:hypothetical protein